MTVIIVVTLWMSMSTGFLSFVAGLQGVDRSDVVEMGVREQDPRRHEAFFPQ